MLRSNFKTVNNSTISSRFIYKYRARAQYLLCDLQKSVINFGSLIRLYWTHCIAITCVFKLAGVHMRISVGWCEMQRLHFLISWLQTTEVSFTSVLETEVKLRKWLTLETKVWIFSSFKEEAFILLFCLFFLLYSFTWL